MTKPVGADGGTRIRCAVLHPGTAAGEVLVLDEPLSFWGGVSADGVVIDRHHPQRGTSLAGAVVAMAAGRGSSSSSSVLAELIRAGAAPVAILLAEPEAILVIGAVVAAELYGRDMPILQLDLADLQALRSGSSASVTAAAQQTRWPPVGDGADRAATLVVTAR